MAGGDAVQQIKERLSIVDVVSAYVELKQAGRNMKACCPFHNEKTPSFTISPDRGMYYCYGCSKGGDMFTFIEEIDGVDFKGALKILAEKAGVELVAEDPKKRSERERQYDVLEAATVFFQKQLTDKKGAETYLEERGVKPATIAKWRIGYAPGPPEHGWRDTKEYLEGKKFTQTELVKAGLIKGADAGKEPYDVFRDRVMFPIFDAAGKVVAYSGRILTKDTEAPKYVNSPETELFNKSEILYGYDKAKQGIRTFDFSLIVEGQFDVVMAHQAGYSNTVAVSGTALTPHHVTLLQRLSNKVVLALDADRAGIAAVKRGADIMLARGMDVKVAHIPDGADPADLIQKNVADFKAVIGQATHVIEYLLDVLEKEGKDERTFKLKAREEILPYVVKIPNRIDQEHFETIIAERLGTTKDAIHFEVERISELQKEKSTHTEAAPLVVPQTSQEVPLLQRKDDVRTYLSVLTEVITPLEKDLITEALFDITGKTIETLLNQIETEQMSKLSFEIESQLDVVPKKQLHEDIVDHLNELRALYLKEAMRNHTEALKEAESREDETEIATLLGEITRIQKSLGTQIYTIEMFATKEATEAK